VLVEVSELSLARQEESSRRDPEQPLRLLSTLCSYLSVEQMLLGSG